MAEETVLIAEATTGTNVVTIPATVGVAALLAANVPEIGSVTLVVPDEVNVIECPPEVISDPPSEIVSVAELAGAVIATLLIEVAVATPRTGVTNVGEVPNTKAPDPVSSVTAEAKLALEGVAKNVATLAANPDIPVLTGNPVQFVRVPEAGVPRVGVTNVGEVANTSDPVPVSSVTAEIRLALDGVARKVAIPVPRPDIPVETGRPVQLVNVPLVGVPKRGVTRVGEVANTAAPVPVSSDRAPLRSALVIDPEAKDIIVLPSNWSKSPADTVSNLLAEFAALRHPIVSVLAKRNWPEVATVPLVL